MLRIPVKILPSVYLHKVDVELVEKEGGDEIKEGFCKECVNKCKI